ncbi:hypothetical protein E4U17_006703 [Claviceps sp. LM77 group G4]|nr:hypothetical protein E4U17_006703 [Claviceps sp. LM77 group G4]KAG6083895.1 hypothetical protein E4U16_003073 [Claviceps sp. LM84 group G4]
MSKISCLMGELRDPQQVGEWAARLGTRCCGKHRAKAQPNTSLYAATVQDAIIVHWSSGEADSDAALSCIALTMRAETSDVC